ncbi:MAG: hypothetical protein J0H98_02580 [Solirubrobacterales bacterium]|nr:hypothetical protein [Solirubrobacterales bacterium]
MRLLLAAGLCLGLVVAGCGGSDEDATVPPAPDRSAQVKRLEDRIDRLRDQIDDEQAAREHAAAAADPEADPGVGAMLGRLGGSAGLAVGAPGSGGPDLSGGSFGTGDAWSTIKVPIVARVLQDAGGPSGLTAAQESEITNAITLSDNDAAAALFADLEAEHGGLGGASEAVGEVLRQAGDGTTVISTQGRDGFSTYGQTEWSLADQFRYMAALAGGCVSDSASRAYLLGKMAAVGGSDTYGLGAAGFPAKWKGGWGPGLDGKYLVRQMGVMDVNGKEIVVAMAAIPDDGSFESGQSMLSHIARWTAAHLADRVSAPTGC